MFSQGKLIFIFSSLVFGPFFFGGLEGCEISLVIVESFVVLVDNVGCHFVEEVSVVRDDEDGAGVADEVVGEVCYGWDIQHVAGFYKVNLEVWQ